MPPTTRDGRSAERHGQDRSATGGGDGRSTLDAFLTTSGAAIRPDAAAAVRGLARDRAAAGRSGASRSEARSAPTSRSRRGINADGDVQKELDVFADEHLPRRRRGARRSRSTPRRSSTSRCVLDPAAPLALAIDPLDGSSNIDAQRLDRHDLLAPPRGWRAGRRPGRQLPAAGQRASSPPASSSTGRSSRWCSRSASGTHVFVLSAPARRLRARLRERARSRRAPRIRHQRLELPALGRGGAALCRRLPERAPTARASATSTCAGSPRWSPRPTAS